MKKKIALVISVLLLSVFVVTGCSGLKVLDVVDFTTMKTNRANMYFKDIKKRSDKYEGKTIKAHGFYRYSNNNHFFDLYDNCCVIGEFRITYDGTYPANETEVIIEGIYTNKLIAVSSLIIVGSESEPGSVSSDDELIIDYDVTAMNNTAAGQFVAVMLSTQSRDLYVGKNIKIEGKYLAGGSIHNINVWDGCCGANIRLAYTGQYPPNNSTVIIEATFAKTTTGTLYYYLAVTSLNVK